MTNSVVAEPYPLNDRSRWEHANEIVAAILLGGFLVACTIRLWPEWIRDPDLSHGLVTPIVFVILLREDFQLPIRKAGGSLLNWTAGVAAAAVGLLFFAAANLYSAALGWSHNLVLFLLANATGAFVISWLLIATTRRRGNSLSWPAAAAAFVWPLSAPIPPGTYTQITQGLQAGVAEAVLRSLHLLGVTAERIGNVITLAHVSIGVEEACSGIRSLISCLFAAVFLSATLCRRTWARVILIGLAVPLALFMNFLRSLTLTLLANNGTDIEGFWHDATGYGILGATALVLVGVSRILEQSARRPVDELAVNPSVSTDTLHRDRTAKLRVFFNATLIAALTLFLVFFAKTRAPSHVSAAEHPDLAGLLPAEAAGWEVSTRADLYQFAAQLQTPFLFERSYTRESGHEPVQVTLYVAFWPAGQAPVSLVEAHTPDACWPGGGWVENVSAHRTQSIEVGGRGLPPAEFRRFQLQGYPQNVWYWHLFDGAVVRKMSTRSAWQLLSLAWHYGFRHDSDQYFVRVSSNRSWEEIKNEPLLIDTFTRLKTLGL